MAGAGLGVVQEATGGEGLIRTEDLRPATGRVQNGSVSGCGAAHLGSVIDWLREPRADSQSAATARAAQTGLLLQSAVVKAWTGVAGPRAIRHDVWALPWDDGHSAGSETLNPQDLRSPRAKHHRPKYPIALGLRVQGRRCGSERPQPGIPARKVPNSPF
ncbi:hypothetical protein AAFF_G00214170 [Aldrovandia affinis]|uniref:Uncharacterized protein n=1 Tax=Aldrovandia affinis TaxID=143900 RepID=A0AAD7W4V4_9TELE|nr:hypothetical protein AAFF_G00214170 [Aldrovandia affinis]